MLQRRKNASAQILRLKRALFVLPTTLTLASKKSGLRKALREEGIDERKIARGYANTHNKLGDSADKGDIKLFR